MNNKKEIIIVINYMANGGAQRVLSELANEWSINGHKITIVQTTPELMNNSYTINKNIELINIKNTTSKIYNFINTLFQLFKIIKERKNATVINFLNSNLIFVCISTLFLNNRFVFSERCCPKKSPKTRIKRLIRDFLYHFCNKCVFQTIEARKYFSKKIQQKSVIIPNPINSNLPDIYSGERNKTIVAIGRLNEQKNYTMLIKAFSKLSLEYPDYKLEIYGQGEEKELLNNLIIKYSMQNQIYLMGFCKDIFNKIKDCSMYVSSSNYEGISNSMLEALSMGLPVIATDCPVGGARMVIENEVNGLLIPVGDETRLYKSMKRIIEDKIFAKKISNEAVKIRVKYPIEKIASEWIKII